MTDNKMADIPQEGDITFPEGTEEETSSDSPAENNGEDGNPSLEGEDENTPDENPDNKPFDQHPRWQQREKEWTERFNKQEQRHQDDIAELRKEFGQARKDNAEATEIPSWFGGTQDQWNEYRAFNDKQIKVAEDRALERLSKAKVAEDDAVTKATEYMQSEITLIQGDKILNPEGKKVDPNKLLKTVIDNDLVDSQGRWNYKAGWRLMQQGQPAASASSQDDKDVRKQIAGATTSKTSKGEPQPKTFKTMDDFKNNRPW